MDKGKAAQNQKPKRIVVKMMSTPAAKKSIKRAAEELGMKEQSVLGRLVEWFDQQDDVMRKYCLGLLPGGYEAEILRKAADRIDAKQKGK